jgi:MFS family permease
LFLIVLSLVGFVTAFGAHVLAVNLPVYAKSTGTGLFEIGVIIAAYDIAELFAKPVFGRVADKRGMVATTVVGLLVFSFGSLLYLVLDPRLILVTRVLQGLGAAAFSTSSMALVAELYKDNRGRAFGIYNSIKGSGFVLGPLLGGAIVFYSDFQAIFIVTFLVGIAVAIPASRIRYASTRPLEMEDDDSDLKQLLSSFGDRILLPWYLLSFANMVLMGALFGFLPIYLSSLGYNQLLVGAVVGLVAVVYVGIQPLSGSLADRHGSMPLTILGSTASFTSMMLLSLLRGPLLVLDCAITAAGIGMVWTVTTSGAAEVAGAGKTGLVMGNLGSYKELGDMTGPIVVGTLAQAVSLQAGFISSGALAALVTIPLVLGWRRRRRAADHGSREGSQS